MYVYLLKYTARWYNNISNSKGFNLDKYTHYGRLLLCRVPKHTAKPYMHTAKTLSCAAHGKEHTTFRRRQICYITWGRPMNIYAGTYLWYVWGAEFRIVSMGPRTESNAPPTSKPYIFRYFHIDIIISPYISSPSLVISSFQVIYSSSPSFNPSISWM